MALMLEIAVHANAPLAIAAAFKKMHEMVKSGSLADDAPIHLTVAPGQYYEILSYNLSNPLIMETPAGTSPEACVITAENCEAFHRGCENRAVFVVGMAATRGTIRGFTIENTHIKTENAENGNQAEAFCWHNQKGRLLAERMRFVSRQNTLHVKGVSWFRDCYVTGDVDFIAGSCDVSLWERCHIHTRADNRNGSHTAYAVQSTAQNGSRGFVFADCAFTADARPADAPAYVARSAGLGSATSADGWDSVALVNCTLDGGYHASLWADDGSVAVYPPVSSATLGWREYNTKTADESGLLVAADTARRSRHGYVMSDKEFAAHYASAAAVLGAHAAAYDS